MSHPELAEVIDRLDDLACVVRKRITPTAATALEVIAASRRHYVATGEALDAAPSE